VVDVSEIETLDGRAGSVEVEAELRRNVEIGAIRHDNATIPMAEAIEVWKKEHGRK
jgi:hypothetical protein